MRLLIDILHPAHVHFFKNFYAEMTARGHELLITARDKEISTGLLESYDLPYRLISRQQTGTIGLASELAVRTSKLMRVTREFRPTVMTGIMGPSIALAGKLQRIPAVVFYDTEFATQTNWFVYPLAHSVCTPDCYQDRVRGRQVTYPGYHELAYLHPNRFTPDPSKLRAFGVQPQGIYTVVRFVSWQAVHDRRELGFSLEQKKEVVSRLQRFGRVLISSEDSLPEELRAFELMGPVEDIHHLLAHAQLIVGESATMASEAAVLGVPAIFLATTGRGYIDDQQKRYGLARHFTEEHFSDALEAIETLFEQRRDQHSLEQAHEKLLDEKIDLTSWMIDYFEQAFGE